MADDPDPDRLRELSARIERAKGQPAPDRSATGKAFSQGEMAWRMVIELVSGLLIGLSFGYALDWWFGTMPVFLVIFVLLGFVAGIRVMLRTAAEMNRDGKD